VSAAPGAAEEAIYRAERIDDLDGIVAMLAEACRRCAAGEDTAFALRLAVEEVFTNILRHGYPDGHGPVRIGVRTPPGRIVVTLDDEALAFDPRDAPPADLAADWSDRPLGGLGWHLVRQHVDEVHHAPLHPRGNRVTLVKRRPADPAPPPRQESR
jgi:serine/threonine-protein kinase RsbW